MYAIVNISGKQFKAIEGSRLRIPKQNSESGSTISFENVLLFNDGKETKFGSPNVKNVKVTTTVLEHKRDRKILVYKKKRRKGYQRKNGHRQWFTEVQVTKIETSAKKSKPKIKKKKTEKAKEPLKKED